MSIFTMEDVTAVQCMPTQAAKNYAFNIVELDSTAKLVTKNKAKLMISKCRSTEAVMTGMTGWILAHPNEGLKVL